MSKISMSKKGSTGGRTRGAGFIPPYVHGHASPKGSRVLASQANARAASPIYIWQDADDEPGTPRSGTYTQYAHRQTAGKARLTAIIKPDVTKASVAEEHVFPKALVGRGVRQWVIEAHAAASAAKTLATVAQAMRARKLGAPAERAGTVPVDTELLKSAGEVTGITDPVELVRFALSLLLQPDLSGDVMREERGAAPGFEMDY